ncbi:MAG: response regulator transcription factor [Prolixibacteraceae bacterium]|jgi:DNA-binding NarL/FixJ family response regulator|nr:response regulator transcription factor [Prolixibacteraceae bacterium]
MTPKGYGHSQNLMFTSGKISTMSITVGIVEDHEEFRKSLAFLISSIKDYKVVWSFGSVEEAIQYNVATDVIMLDISLPRMTGLEAIQVFKNRWEETKIIMLTILEDEYNIMTAIKNGADGYILKKTNPQKILDAIQQVFEGGAALTPMVAKQVLSFFKPDKKVKEHISILTKREQEILSYIVSGITNEQIAVELFISTQTVRNHIKNIYEKLHVHSKAQVVAKALTEKMV